MFLFSLLLSEHYGKLPNFWTSDAFHHSWWKECQIPETIDIYFVIMIAQFRVAVAHNRYDKIFYFTDTIKCSFFSPTTHACGKSIDLVISTNTVFRVVFGQYFFLSQVKQFQGILPIAFSCLTCYHCYGLFTTFDQILISRCGLFIQNNLATRTDSKKYLVFKWTLTHFIDSCTQYAVVKFLW